VLEKDENNSRFSAEGHDQDNREQGKIRQVEIENELPLSRSLFSLYLFFRRESERDPAKSAVTRTLEFIRNHVPRCHDDYFMLIRSRSKGV